MNEDQLRAAIDEHLALITYSSKALKEAPERTTRFLIMVALLADSKRESEEDRAKLNTLVSASKAQAISRSSLKGITEKKIEAEQDDTYTQMKESLEQCEARINWLKTYINIFENAHLTYRQFSRE